MTEAITKLLSTIVICGTVFTTIAAIAAFVNADTLVRAWQRYHGEKPEESCPRCNGTGRRYP